MAGAPLGNQNGRKGSDWRNALKRALDQYNGPKAPSGMALAKIAENVVDKALDGDWDAIDEIANRIDGKPTQTLDATFDAGSGLIAILAGLRKGNNPPVA